MKVMEIVGGFTVLLDDEDFIKVSALRWKGVYSGGKVYAERSNEKTFGKRTRLRRTALHRVIMGVTDPLVIVDHINGDTLDDRKVNLRLCNRAENTRNSKIPTTNKSGFKGVRAYLHHFQAYISYEMKSIHIGTFETAEEGAVAYDRKAIELFGEFANTNFPLENYINVPMRHKDENHIPNYILGKSGWGEYSDSLTFVVVQKEGYGVDESPYIEKGTVASFDTIHEARKESIRLTRENNSERALITGWLPNTYWVYINALTKKGELLHGKVKEYLEEKDNSSQFKYKQSKNKSGFRGVIPARRGKFESKIFDRHTNHFLGVYDTAIEAARAYDRKVIELKGPKARLNFPLSDYITTT